MKALSSALVLLSLGVSPPALAQQLNTVGDSADRPHKVMAQTGGHQLGQL